MQVHGTRTERLLRNALDRVKAGLCLTGTPARRAKCRLQHIIARDREAVPCGAWRMVRLPVWEVSWGRDGMRRVPGICRWEVRR